jgi:hypothetical protein
MSDIKECPNHAGLPYYVYATGPKKGACVDCDPPAPVSSNASHEHDGSFVIDHTRCVSREKFDAMIEHFGVKLRTSAASPVDVSEAREALARLHTLARGRGSNIAANRDWQTVDNALDALEARR